MVKQTDKDGHLGKKLMAIGIYIAINFKSCMVWHIKQAIDDGATVGEISLEKIILYIIFW